MTLQTETSPAQPRAAVPVENGRAYAFSGDGVNTACRRRKAALAIAAVREAAGAAYRDVGSDSGRELAASVFSPPARSPVGCLGAVA